MPRARKPGSGGPRTGTPGTNYSQRSDLNQHKQPITTAPNQTYGVATQQRQAQQAIPLAGNTPVPPSAPALGDPTQRPAEPLTTGIASGAGAGPEANTPPTTGTDDTLEATIRGLYNLYPNSDLAKLVAQVSARRGDIQPMSMQLPAATGQPAPKVPPRP